MDDFEGKPQPRVRLHVLRDINEFAAELDRLQRIVAAIRSELPLDHEGFRAGTH